MINRELVIEAFDRLGRILEKIGNGDSYPGFEIGITAEEYDSLQKSVEQQEKYNAWFTQKNVQNAFISIASYLHKDKLYDWSKNYTYHSNPKKVGIVMAGNIPLVGFHDMLCVVIAGNCAVCKMSSKDQTLLPILVEILCHFAPQLKEYILFAQGTIGNFDAVIATGSDHSMRYFEQYFGKFPHIFRKNRTSVAILNGNETAEQLKALGNDIFEYFGLGCRNVSHLLLPNHYDFSLFIESMTVHQNIIYHHKYANNYDYYKAVYLMNKLQLIDPGFILMRETKELHAPLSVVYYHFYDKKEEVDAYLKQHHASIQAIIGNEYIPFGQSQRPTLIDYADNVNTLQWLEELFE